MAIDLKYGKIQISGIPDDEPVFIIRGQDSLAQHVIHDYADEAARAGCGPIFVQKVREAAYAVERWTKKKRPD